MNVAIPNEVCIAASRLFALFKPVILKLPRVSLHYSALPALSSTWMRHRGWPKSWARLPKAAFFLAFPWSKTPLPRMGRTGSEVPSRDVPWDSRLPHGGSSGQAESWRINMQETFLVESSWAIQEPWRWRRVLVACCPQKLFPRLLEGGNWWLEEGARRCTGPYGTYTA